MNFYYIRPVILTAALLFFFTTVFSSMAMAYVMPVDQILELSNGNFSHFRTLVITQSTHLKNGPNPDNDIIFNEKIWINAVGQYDLESYAAQTDPDVGMESRESALPIKDMSYRPLLMESGLHRKKTLLSDMGIDLNEVAFTRFEGIIGYRIGKKDPSEPKLIIEKATFLPIFLCYRVYRNSEVKTVKVKFENYQKVNQGWYPFEILVLIDEIPTEQYMVQNIEVNTPIERPLSEIKIQVAPEEWIRDEPSVARENQQLKEIIEMLKEKY